MKIFFEKSLKRMTALKCIQWDSNCFMRTDVRTNMTWLTFAFLNVANEPTKRVILHQLSDCEYSSTERVMLCLRVRSHLQIGVASNPVCASSSGILAKADCNMTAHAQKPDFVFRAKRTSPFNLLAPELFF
jgi:hypothetical protein